MHPYRPDLRSGELAGRWREFREAGREAEALAAELTPGQLWWRPDPERWSVGECLDHLVRTGEAYLEALDRSIEDARSEGLLGHGPHRRTLVGRFLTRVLEPPPGLAVSAPAEIRPRRPPPATEAETGGHEGTGSPLDDFLALRPRLGERLEAADGLALGKVRVASPFFRFVRFDLGSAFAIIAAHERRHLWQAGRVRDEDDFPAR